MSLTLTQKKATVAALYEKAGPAPCVVLSHYRGVPVEALTRLRAQARARSVHVGVYRNTLVRRAFQETHFAVAESACVGPLMTLISLDPDHPAASAAVLRDFIRENKGTALAPAAVLLPHRLLPCESLDRVAALPHRDEALARLILVMKQPITRFVRTSIAPVRQLVCTLAAYADTRKQP